MEQDNRTAERITAIASDFDGTILREGEQQVRAEFFPLIGRMKEQGIRFVAASGRQYANLRWLMKPVEQEISFISENGALVASRGRILYTSAIDKALVLELLEDMRRIGGTETLVSTPETYYAVPQNPWFMEYLRGHMHMVAAEAPSYEAVREDILKVSIWWQDGMVQEKADWFHARYDGRLQVVDGGNGWLDFNNPGTSKGKALELLARQEGFELKSTVSFGDSENDVEMFRRTGFSYVMSSAREHVKREGSCLCDDVLPVMQGFLRG